ncbi:uncharacterized protein LACBIDRAFT_307858 [Laccaria bicolor S238N-H82]|uniref:Predicted protein n=1 Tax=Laccaria bicolor (strain S238N-H82 / ATCC MYA-4686) TaxID=486041 RepID=B0DR74_LACBS|nr:uncharacterized protein LACBIDRAFT_307858 [Laccaria bicolor S238N-H82]EDR02952.1 predicted protein [Laccaria bicolor S238N-H82]|eukprot:XP_001886375.1 predicted protein [Laccaria bicolor S238N-H82]
MSSFQNFQPTPLFFLLVGGYGMLLTLSAVFLHYNLLRNPVLSLSFQLSLLILQPILLGLFARLCCRHPFRLLAEIIFIGHAYILARSERLWPSSIITSLPSVPQNTAIVLFLVIGDITFKVLHRATAGSREQTPPTFVEIFMTYGRRFGLQMLALGRHVVDITKTVMDFAAEVGRALYAIVGDASSTGQSDVELGDHVDSLLSAEEHGNIGARESN